MKTPEEMAAYFRSMPSVKKTNPYWRFVESPLEIRSVCTSTEDVPAAGMAVSSTVYLQFDLGASKDLLIRIREFFRRYYESFKSEAQVLCVAQDDGMSLMRLGVPVLTEGVLGPFNVMVMVLPQDNHMGTSVISEAFWQERIVNAGIKPIARIHSHHILDPYQSGTDYSTLNSGTLEMVIGRIFDNRLKVCYWLDVPGTDTKARTFVAEETVEGSFNIIHRIFNGPNAPDIRTLYPGAIMRDKKADGDIGPDWDAMWARSQQDVIDGQ